MRNLLLLSFSFVVIVLMSQTSKTLESTVIKSNHIKKNINERNIKQKPNIDYVEYINVLTRCIQIQWKPPHTRNNSHVLLTRFSILSDGTWLKNSINIISNTGSDADKLAVENTLQEASSKCIFPLPQGAPSHVTVKFEFKTTGIVRIK